MAREERKTEILRAASRVFYLKGFERAKIEDIAKEAGIGKGTVYEYFHSKQELFDEAVSFNRRMYIERITKILDMDGTFREKFIALAKYQTALVKEHIPIFNMMSTSRIMAREVGALILEQNIKVIEILSAQIKEAMTRGEIRKDIDPEMAAAIMVGTLNQYCNKEVIFADVHPDDLDYEKIADIIFHGIS